MHPPNQEDEAVLDERQSLLRPDDTNFEENVDCQNPRSSNQVSTESIHMQSLDIRTQLRIVAVMLCFATTGMYSTAIGALLLELEKYYSLTDSSIASIFPVAVIGYISGTFLIPIVLPRYGWKGVASIAPMLQALGVATISTAPPFGIVLFANFCAGVGTGLSDSGFCAWASKLPYTNVVQGLMHGSYSVGCILGPLVCTAVLKRQCEWYIFYRIMTLWAIFVLTALVLTFRSEDFHRFRSTHIPDQNTENKGSHRTRLVWLCGVFYFFYVSIECTFSNWIPAYMERVRGVDAATASMSSSTFWFGMALGRFLLGPVTQFFGLNSSVAVYIMLATSSQAVFRLKPSKRVSMILLGGTGFFFAPMFPSGVVQLAAKLPMHEYVGGVAVAAAMGQVGSAIAQTLIGFMAERLGLAPLIDAMLVSSVLLLFSWVFFCRIR